MDIVTLAGLVKIELPHATLRLCDGAFVKWGAETYEASDPAFGTIGSMEPIDEGVGDEIPALRMNFLPNSTATASELSRPEYQGCRIRMWIAEVDINTNVIVGTPSLEFDGQADSTDLVIDRGSRELEMDVVSAAERLFVINEGNTLSPRFHKLLYPGELGEDNAIGVGVGIAWGTAQPTAYSNGGFASGGGRPREFGSFAESMR